jgi:N-acetylglucosaminyldiphosphoundecaprenol N-acetyl-beta-D-mannosaminyltransferase
MTSIRFAALRPGEVGVTTAGRDSLLAEMEARLREGQGFAVATLNLDHAVKLGRDPEFHAAYAMQSHVVADGNPIVWLCRLAGRRVELIPGSDLIDPFVALAAECRVGVALVGSTEAALSVAGARLEAAHPGLRVLARVAPPMGFDPAGEAADTVLDAVASSGARVVLLALGAPKQEVMAARGLARHPTLGFLSIGAGLDFIAQTQRRAPVWMRALALEWLWRLLRDPKRLGARYAACAVVLPRLAVLALAERFQGDGVSTSEPSEKRMRSTEKSR